MRLHGTYIELPLPSYLATSPLRSTTVLYDAAWLKVRPASLLTTRLLCTHAFTRARTPVERTDGLFSLQEHHWLHTLAETRLRQLEVFIRHLGQILSSWNQVDMDYSPAISVTSDMTEEELEKYFATYVPLSNLPTPPPVKDKQQALPESAKSQPSVSWAQQQQQQSFSSSSQKHDASSQAQGKTTLCPAMPNYRLRNVSSFNSTWGWHGCR